MRAMTRAPNRENLTEAILREAEEFHVKEAWSELFNHVFPFAWDKTLKKLIRVINRQSTKQMVLDIISEFEKQNLHGLLPMFAMP